MSVKKKIVASMIVLAIVAVATYGLFVFQGGNMNRGDGGDGGGGVLGSSNVRTIIILSVVGGSAFITGFGLRDVIGRAMAARQRSRLKQMGAQGTH